MGFQLSGRAFKEFINADRNGAVFEDEEILVDGRLFDGSSFDDIDDAAYVEILTGFVYPNGKEYIELGEFAKEWLRRQRTCIVAIEMDKDLKPMFLDYVSLFYGAKVI